jgi:hypothetical protein
VTDLAVLLYVVPVLVAPIAAIPMSTFLRAALRPVPPALAAALVVLVAVGRATVPDTLLGLLPLGVAWAAVSGLLLWRFGLDAEERIILRRTLRGSPGGAVPEPA